MADATLNEIRQRATRIESRICRMADALGISVGAPDKALTITKETEDFVRVDTEQLDLTISEVKLFLGKQGKQGKIALVSYAGRTVATIYPDTHVGD